VCIGKQTSAFRIFRGKGFICLFKGKKLREVL